MGGGWGGGGVGVGVLFYFVIQSWFLKRGLYPVTHAHFDQISTVAGRDYSWVLLGFGNHQVFSL